MSECEELRDANVSALKKLSSSLLLSFLHNHRSKDVKALTAASILEIFRLFHPNHPYTDEDLKVSVHNTYFALFILFYLFFYDLKYRLRSHYSLPN